MIKYLLVIMIVISASYICFGEEKYLLLRDGYEVKGEIKSVDNNKISISIKGILIEYPLTDVLCQGDSFEDVLKNLSNQCFKNNQFEELIKIMNNLKDIGKRERRPYYSYYVALSYWKSLQYCMDNNEWERYQKIKDKSCKSIFEEILIGRSAPLDNEIGLESWYLEWEVRDGLDYGNKRGAFDKFLERLISYCSLTGNLSKMEDVCKRLYNKDKSEEMIRVCSEYVKVAKGKEFKEAIIFLANMAYDIMKDNKDDDIYNLKKDKRYKIAMEMFDKCLDSLERLSKMDNISNEEKEEVCGVIFKSGEEFKMARDVKHQNYVVEKIYKKIYETFPKSKYVERVKFLELLWVNDNKKKYDLINEFMKKFPQSEYIKDVKYILGINLMENKKYKEAIDIFEEIIRENPKSTIVDYAKEKIEVAKSKIK